MQPELSKISSPSLRAFLRKNPYKPYGSPSMDVENLLLETATQVDVFYGLCNGSSRPPTQEEYVKIYLDLCGSEISQKGANLKEVGKRIARAWGSFIPELDFYCQLRDSGLFDQLTIDTEFDTQKGYDVEVVYKGKTYNIALYYETPWAKKWLKNKARRKAGLLQPLKFPLKEQDAEFIGGLHFYTSQHVEKLRRMLNVDG